MLTTEGTCAILSCLLEQQASSWKSNAKINILLQRCLFYTKAKGPFNRRFPCLKKRRVQPPKSELGACPCLISWRCAGSTAGLSHQLFTKRLLLGETPLSYMLKSLVSPKQTPVWTPASCSEWAHQGSTSNRSLFGEAWFLQRGDHSSSITTKSQHCPLLKMFHYHIVGTL